jgi:hypothetical protein
LPAPSSPSIVISLPRAMCSAADVIAGYDRSSACRT